MNNAPYIYTFKTSEQCYVYDVNTNKILRISEEVHDYLSSLTSATITDEHTITFVEEMKANGFLRSDRVEISEHPATSLLTFYLKNRLCQLILQVTQNCNLRCSYCTYSGLYKTRTHSSDSMSVEVAEKAIDFFIKRAKDSKTVTISFYGGEPLLNMCLIKHCVSYIESRYYGKKIDYAITTNGTLLDENSIPYLAEKRFHLLISIDGPKEIHDKHRRFADSGNGTYSIIMDNVARIKRHYPDYYQANVRFNTVFDTENDFSCVNDYITGDEILGADKFSVNYVTDNYTNQKMEVNEEFTSGRDYEYFKFLLAKLGVISMDKASPLLASKFAGIFLRCFQNVQIEQNCIPRKFHHSGPCIPGAIRLFVDTKGRFFPCERVSELSETVILGDIENGISLEKARQIINPEVVTHAMCRDCWAYRHCFICVATVDDMQGVSEAETCKRCPSVLATIDNQFKDYCVLKELGYTFDEERMYKGIQ